MRDAFAALLRRHPRVARRTLAALIAVGAAVAGVFSAIEPIEAHDRSALATAVRSCWVAKKTLHTSFPCLSVSTVDQTAVIRPPLAKSEVLLVPTVPVTGIESPLLVEKNAPDYLAEAWAARGYVLAALPRDPGPAGLGMAVNSLPTRSQDRLHIHVDCLQPRVIAALARYGGRLGSTWTRFPVPLAGGRYFARAIGEGDLVARNPFRLVATGVPGAARTMADMTLVVAPITRADGRPGFALIAANTEDGSHAMGENLLDHSCRIARLAG